MSRSLVLALLAATGLGAPAFAQPSADPHAHHPSTPTPAPDPHAGHGAAASGAQAGHGAAQAADPHAGHAGHGAQTKALDPHEGHGAHVGHGSMSAGAMTGDDLPVGAAAPPPIPQDDLADAIHGAAVMDRARRGLRTEHGGARVSQFMIEEAEATSGHGGGYGWDVEAWTGDDHNRFVLKSEGEGLFDEGLEAGEVQALWSRPVGVYTDLQFGVRHDFEPGPQRTYATAGFETLAPYWFEVEGAVLLSDKGDVSARIEGRYDLRLTQRLVLQPSAELQLAAEASPKRGLGSGLTDAELSLRLRYELKREFAPYLGVVWGRKLGDTADFARAEGESAAETRAVVGLRAWF